MHGLERRLPPLVDPASRATSSTSRTCSTRSCSPPSTRSPGEGAVYNVGSGAQTTLRELAEAARGVFAIAEQPNWGSFPARGWDTDVWVADPRRIEAELGWRARTPIEAGLAATAQWLGGRSAAGGALPRRDRSRCAEPRSLELPLPATATKGSG